MRRITSISELRKNKQGGIEGLPLQLMIVILVATLGTAIILGWMGSLDTPHKIGDVNADPDNIYLDMVSGSEHYTDTGHVKIYVTDQNGDGLPGAAVILKGCGVVDSEGKTVYGTTDAKGYVEFSDLHVSLRGSGIGYIDITASKSGYGTHTTARIMVVA